jgi:acylphosphatase
MEAASRLGIAGWVRNRANGTVEVAAAGSADAIAELEKAIAKGPSFSLVKRVERHDISLESIDCNSFEIR